PYLIANHGQAPAMIDRLEYSLGPGLGPEDTGAAWDDHPLVISPVLGIGAQVACSAHSVKWIDSGGRVVDLSPNSHESERVKSWAIPEIEIEGTTWFFRVKVFYRGPF